MSCLSHGGGSLGPPKRNCTCQMSEHTVFGKVGYQPPRLALNIKNRIYIYIDIEYTVHIEYIYMSKEIIPRSCRKWILYLQDPPSLILEATINHHPNVFHIACQEASRFGSKW